MAKTVKLTIDNVQVEVPADYTVLQAAQSVGIEIPTLCYLEGINKVGACRACSVEVEGRPNLQASCTLPVGEGMVVKTNSRRVREARRNIVSLILANNEHECLTCFRNQNCELQKMAKDLSVTALPYGNAITGRKEKPDYYDESFFVRDDNRCILCGRCIAVCAKVQKVFALDFANRGYETIATSAFNSKQEDAACLLCGQCVLVCPVGALRAKDETEKVWDALEDPKKHVVVQEAPAIRAALGEEFGMEPGSLVTGKMAAALRRLGFDKVFDTQFSADVTIMEEATEFVSRLEKIVADPSKKPELFPMITSCSPGWIKGMEHFYPEVFGHASSCKSPQQMFGALVKTYYAEKAGIDPKDIYSVSIMPCTAKKFESTRPEMFSSGYQDVDTVLTTRELGRMVREAGIDFVNLPDEEFDSPMGESTGAATIFGTTGGVMEAALRTAYEVLTGNTLDKVNFEMVRDTNLQGIIEADINLGDITLPFSQTKLPNVTIKVAIANGFGNARKLLDQIKAGTSPYDFIEIMTCPGGCIGGGGQPIPTTDEIRKKRAAALYREDENLPLRKSHENAAVKKLYDDFLGEPNGHKSHELLHTHYTKRDPFCCDVIE